MKYFFHIVVSLFLIISCKKERTIPFASVKVGSCESATISGSLVKICLDSVMNDSRCPSNAECVWQGMAYARFSMSINGAAPQVKEMSVQNFPFHQLYPSVIVLEGYRITFKTLSPYPGESNYSYNKLNAGMEVVKP